MPKLSLTPRQINIFAAAFCVFLLVAAAYFEYVQGLQPCPLCLVQRWLVLLLAVIFFLGVLLKRRAWQYCQSIMVFIVSVLGIIVGARHVWLQHLPADRIPECGPGLKFMLQHFPLQKTLSFLVSGTGECAKVDWQLLGLSMAEWLLGFFIVFALLSLVNLRLLSKTR